MSLAQVAPPRNPDVGAALGDRRVAGAPERLRDPGLREKELREIAQGFEAIFFHMLMKSMRATVKKSELFNGGRGEEMFTDLLDMHVAEGGARRGGGLGIADMIVKKYSRQVAAAAEKGARTHDRVA